MTLPQPSRDLSVDIWLWNNADQVAQADDLFKTLNREECARRDRQFSSEKGVLWAIARANVRARLGAITGQPANELVFEENAYGKPNLAGRTLSFSISHDGAWTALAVCAAAPVGIDIEAVQTLQREEMDWPLSAVEKQHLAQVAPVDLPQAFFRYWTLKEAFIKALGLGVSFPLHDFDMSPFGEAPSLLRVKGDAAAVRDWTFEAHEIRPNQRFAVAVKTGGESVKFTYHAKNGG